MNDARRVYGVFLHLASYPLPSGGSYDETTDTFIPWRQLIVKPIKSYRGPKKEWLLEYDDECGLPGDVGDELLIAVYPKADGNLYSSPCAVSCALDVN